MHDDSARLNGKLARLRREWLEPAREAGTHPVAVAAWDVPDEPVPPAEAIRAEYEPFTVGSPWSRPWGTTWFHVRGTVPEGWGGDAALLVDLGFSGAGPGFQAEGLAFRPDGSTVKAIAPRNRHVPVEPGPGGEFELYIEAAANPDVMRDGWTAPTPFGDKATAGDGPIYRLERLELVRRDRDVEELLLDLDVLTGLLGELPPALPRSQALLGAIESMLRALDPDDVPGTARAARAALAPALASPAAASAHEVYAVGHAHIDSAWLWPVRETVRKCARTFSNVLHLMDLDPDFTFAASSAQQYAWIKESYPELFASIRARVAEGRWIPVGGMWVESDTNMVGPEAMVRQFTEGKRFFMEEFGVEPREVWLPDSFGYSAALPQIARKAGADWFLTQKISWNDTNAFPHHTFRWEGIDGTDVFTHFPPVDTYNSDLSGKDLARAERQSRDQRRSNRSIVPFGYGDGGGGPTREMVGRARRTADLEGSPKVRMTAPAAFFTDAQRAHPDAPRWLGELYLEYHRGTYTSQHRTKLGNRRSEHLLRAAELWAATAAVAGVADYPAERLRRLWRTVLLQQFHDILPGSSIAWVHREAERNYEAVRAELEALVAESLRALAGDGDLPLVANAAPAAVDGVPAGAVAARGEAAAEPVALTAADGGHVLDNGLLRVAIDADGLVRSLVDAETGREVVPAGERLGLLRVHRDVPAQWEAWDIDQDYRDSVEELRGADGVEAETLPDGSALVRVRRSRGASAFVQTFTLAPGARRLELGTEVDWHERRRLLKLALPLAVHTDRAASEIQFGHLYRPIHTNTSWDAARFETVAQRWLHVAEEGLGVGVANDQTYGHDVTRRHNDDGVYVVVGESLLRAPMSPDPDADQGRHSMRTTVVVGGVDAAIREGYRLNVPAVPIRGARAVEPLVGEASPGAIVEAVKLADDGGGDVVVRVYEAWGGRRTALVPLGADAAAAVDADLLERPLDRNRAELSGDRELRLELSPFEVRTVRITPRRN
ncbi:glycosyl hydrolase-related protein [Glycomyces sp. A-F 0318]|uniref:alpha-mannosidase n=1 Tax=Glycomyces amatae TaxID=2881355 RepID=UPI001E35C4FF|nr:glycosyl hydrolase-related protein [Glycomyces amatae]